MIIGKIVLIAVVIVICLCVVSMIRNQLKRRRAHRVKGLAHFDLYVWLYHAVARREEKQQALGYMYKALVESVRCNIAYWPVWLSIEEQNKALAHIAHIQHRFIQYVAIKNWKSRNGSVVPAEEIADPMLVSIVVAIAEKMFTSTKNTNDVYSASYALYSNLFPDERYKMLARKVLHGNKLRHWMRGTLYVEFSAMRSLAAIEYVHLPNRQKLVMLGSLCEIFLLQRLEMSILKLFSNKMEALVRAYKSNTNKRTFLLDRFRSEIQFHYPRLRDFRGLIAEINPIHY